MATWGRPPESVIVPLTSADVEHGSQTPAGDVPQPDRITDASTEMTALAARPEIVIICYLRPAEWNWSRTPFFVRG
jgi:hypothetical protein